MAATGAGLPLVSRPSPGRWLRRVAAAACHAPRRRLDRSSGGFCRDAAARFGRILGGGFLSKRRQSFPVLEARRHAGRGTPTSPALTPAAA
jgi:hypothetical protein